jgi:hypothetical protein
MQLTDKLKIAGLFLTGLGLLLTALQIYKMRTQQRAQYLLDTFTSYIKDPDLHRQLFRCACKVRFASGLQRRM